MKTAPARDKTWKSVIRTVFLGSFTLLGSQLSQQFSHQFFNAHDLVDAIGVFSAEDDAIVRISEKGAEQGIGNAILC